MQPDIFLGAQEQGAGQQDQHRAGAQRRRKLAQNQGPGADGGQAPVAQGAAHAPHHIHRRGVPQGDLGVGLGILHHLLGPGHSHHHIPHRSGVEGVAAIAAKGLFAHQDAGHHRHHQHIPADSGRHQQGDDQSKALVGPVGAAVDPAAQNRHQAVAEVAGQQRHQAQQDGPGPVQVGRHADKGQRHPADVLIIPARLGQSRLLFFSCCFFHWSSSSQRSHTAARDWITAAGSAAPKTALPATSTSAPALVHRGAVSALTPPSTSSRNCRPRA